MTHSDLPLPPSDPRLPVRRRPDGVIERNDGTEVWDDTLAPGGWVCAICRTPVESTPCDEHYPNPTDFRTHQWKQLFHPEKGTLCGVAAFDKTFPRFQMVNMIADPREITCNDCIYHMHRVEQKRGYAHV